MIQTGSGRSRENLAMKNEPATKPTDVRPSCSPYSNSVAPRTCNEKGRSRTFHRPNEKNMNAPTANSERMIGVPNSVDSPDFRLSTMTPTLASSSGFGIGWRRMRLMKAAAIRKVPASRMNAQVSPMVPASRPAPANPMAVDPNDAIDRNEFAAASSSSLAISGIRLSCAGSKNCLTPALRRRRRYRPGRAMASIPMTTAMSPTTTAWVRQVQTMIRCRSCRST